MTRFESALPSRTIDNQFDESFEWHIMDSGASVDQHSHHVYVTEDAIAHKILVETAGNETLSNQSSGFCNYEMEDGTIFRGNNTRSYGMKNITHNLVSLMSMVLNGYKVTFDGDLPNGCEVIDKVSGKKLDVKIKDNLPWLKLKPMTSKAASIARALPSKKMDHPWKLVHKIFAHSHVQMLKQLKSKVEGMQVDDNATDFDDCGIEKCIGCQLGKSKHQPFHRNELQAKEFGVFHLDYKSSKVLVAMSAWPDRR